MLIDEPEPSARLAFGAGVGAAVPSPGAATGNLRVLVIDDDVDGADTLCTLLRMSGCDTAIANTGTEGLAQASTFDPQLAFIDLEMPDMGGQEVVRDLRARGQRAKLICLTERGDPTDRQTCLAAGFDELVKKPMQVETLDAVLASARAGLGMN